jgi:all-trans-retinol dehydrogenase (NAD+)
MKKFRHKNVLITGGASGIGLNIAKIYDKKGANLIILDINLKDIKIAKNILKNATFYKCDVSKKSNVYSVSKKILKEHGSPYVLINNAGVVENSNFLECEDDLIERTMNVNILAHFWILKAFLPSMLELKEAYICQIASASGLIGVPGLAVYSASKHAVVGFSKALKLEIEDQGNVHITTVCPSFVNTKLFKGAKAPLLTPILEQNEIAKIIYDSILQKKDFVLEPFMVKAVPLLSAVLPEKLFNKVAKVFNMHTAMDDILSTR